MMTWTTLRLPLFCKFDLFLRLIEVNMYELVTLIPQVHLILCRKIEVTQISDIQVEFKLVQVVSRDSAEIRALSNSLAGSSESRLSKTPSTS